jgi:hypothetical protein
MKISCSSLMVPGPTITAKAETLRQWGFDGMSIFFPLTEWSAAAHREVIARRVPANGFRVARMMAGLPAPGSGHGPFHLAAGDVRAQDRPPVPGRWKLAAAGLDGGC